MKTISFAVEASGSSCRSILAAGILLWRRDRHRCITGMALFEQHCGTLSLGAGGRQPRAGSDRTRPADARSDPRSDHDRTDGGECRGADAGAETRRSPSSWRCGRSGSTRPGARRRCRITARRSRWPIRQAVRTLERLGSRCRQFAFQPAAAAGLTAAAGPEAEAEVGVRFPNGTSAFGQPAVAGGRVFVGSDNGFVYALDAASGCVVLVVPGAGGVRTAISIGPIGTAAAPRYGDLLRRLEGQRLRGRRRDGRAGVDQARRYRIRWRASPARRRSTTAASTCRCRRSRKAPARIRSTSAARSAAAWSLRCANRRRNLACLHDSRCRPRS